MGLSPWLYGSAVYPMPARYTNGAAEMHGRLAWVRRREDKIQQAAGQIFRRFISRSASRSNSSADSGGT